MTARRTELSTAAATLLEPLRSFELRAELQEQVVAIAREYCDVLGEYTAACSIDSGMHVLWAGIGACQCLPAFLPLQLPLPLPAPQRLPASLPMRLPLTVALQVTARWMPRWNASKAPCAPSSTATSWK